MNNTTNLLPTNQLSHLSRATLRQSPHRADASEIRDASCRVEDAVASSVQLPIPNIRHRTYLIELVSITHSLRPNSINRLDCYCLVCAIPRISLLRVSPSNQPNKTPHRKSSPTKPTIKYTTTSARVQVLHKDTKTQDKKFQNREIGNGMRNHTKTSCIPVLLHNKKPKGVRTTRDTKQQHQPTKHTREVKSEEANKHSSR
jgi:hypothetical protein